MSIRVISITSIPVTVPITIPISVPVTASISEAIRSIGISVISVWVIPVRKISETGIIESAVKSDIPIERVIPNGSIVERIVVGIKDMGSVESSQTGRIIVIIVIVEIIDVGISFTFVIIVIVFAIRGPTRIRIFVITGFIILSAGSGAFVTGILGSGSVFRRCRRRRSNNFFVFRRVIYVIVISQIP